jgi:putative restriction endonuclease
VPDNGLALCALHHKLLDRGALRLDDGYRSQVTTAFSARTDTGKLVHELEPRARPGTPLPRPEYVHWHTTQVLKGLALTA